MKKSEKSKTNLFENSDKSTHRKKVELEKSKVINVAIPVSQSESENESYFTLKDYESRATNVIDLTLTEIHSNMSFKDQSRMSTNSVKKRITNGKNPL